MKIPTENCTQCGGQKEVVDIREEKDDTVFELECGHILIKMNPDGELGLSESLKSSDTEGGRKHFRDGGREAKIREGDDIVLEDSVGYTNALLDVPTSKKDEAVQRIKGSLGDWMNNSNFDEFEEGELDLALVLYVGDIRMSRQDVDNIAKVVIDALQDLGEDRPFLIRDDSQIRRVLVEKRPRVPDENFETDDVYISFRRHQSDTSMILVNPDMI